MNAGAPLDAHGIACEALRSCATLRFLRFTVLPGATGGVVRVFVISREPSL
jgi:hypothetical protein